uniref:Uncharacterized protein n=1 Tax=Oryza meridionalis TaxID=40149 RepID=A0A0E0E4N2_9ORYZ
MVDNVEAFHGVLWAVSLTKMELGRYKENPSFICPASSSNYGQCCLPAIQEIKTQEGRLTCMACTYVDQSSQAHDTYGLASE